MCVPYQSYEVSFAGPGSPSFGPSREEMLVDINSALMEPLVRMLLNVLVTATAGPKSSRKVAIEIFVMVQGRNRKGKGWEMCTKSDPYNENKVVLQYKLAHEVMPFEGLFRCGQSRSVSSCYYTTTTSWPIE